MNENQPTEGPVAAPSLDMSLWERYVGQFTQEDSFRLIFDHIRNLGICAAVAAAAHWKYRNVGPGLIAYFDFGLAGLLGTLAVWLYLINQSHMFKRMHKAGIDPMIIQFVGFIHTYLALSIIFSLVLARQ